MRHESKASTDNAASATKLTILLKPLTTCGTLFGIVRFGWWLLIDCFHLDSQGSTAAWLGATVYVLALTVIVLLPFAWRQLSKGEHDSEEARYMPDRFDQNELNQRCARHLPISNLDSRHDND